MIVNLAFGPEISLALKVSTEWGQVPLIQKAGCEIENAIIIVIIKNLISFLYS
jgi:hypothetical protein